ncbi:hypothetical protein RZS08_31365, partial [Arthrospira platensis SPKY1]|nr:hypothetical protein [Arthrospira platensis SPKY1]
MNFTTHKRAALEKRRAELLQEWDALNGQIGRAMNEADKLRLQRQADGLEQEIVDLEAQIAAIPSDPAPPAAPPPIA